MQPCLSTQNNAIRHFVHYVPEVRQKPGAERVSLRHPSTRRFRPFALLRRFKSYAWRNERWLKLWGCFLSTRKNWAYYFITMFYNAAQKSRWDSICYPGGKILTPYHSWVAFEQHKKIILIGPLLAHDPISFPFQECLLNHPLETSVRLTMWKSHVA